jgi:AcrR family transcriptional regulator
MAPNKRDKQREQTHQNLIETAERLFAEHGIAAISLRQIGIEAGSLNTNVVGYYFGTKESLIDAIYDHRIPHIERIRAKMVEDLDGAGKGMDLVELLNTTWVPLRELKDKNGKHSYARFLLSVQRAGLGWTRNVLNPRYPVASEIFRRLEDILTAHGARHLEFRIHMHIKLIVGALEYIDESEAGRANADAIFDDAIRMTSAALLVPSPTG